MEEIVREAEDEDVLDRLLREVMVDAEDLRLVVDLVELFVELPRRLVIISEGLLDDDPRLAAKALIMELLGALGVDRGGSAMKTMTCSNLPLEST